MTGNAGNLLIPERPEVDSILEFARALIAVPSQGGIDASDRIIDLVGHWLAEHGLEPCVLRGTGGDPVGLSVDIGPGTGPRYCLNACLDTAPFGDLRAWSVAPTAGAVRAGWLIGRGAADCKTAIAMFAHIGINVALQATDLSGTLGLLFDADEHTGRFGGVRAYTDAGRRPDGVMIGYPGLDEILVGARGFWRAALHVAGRSGHSGSRSRPADNAIVKAAALVKLLEQHDFSGEEDTAFPLGPKITVTAINGGQGYSMVPDQCRLSVDIRLTPRYDSEWAETLVRELCRSLDEAIPSREPTVVEPEATWPAYHLPPSSPMAASLQTAAGRALGRDVPLRIAGPSNIGNFLMTLGIEATCGFGVAYRNLHGADEAIELSSIPMVYDTYLGAVRRLLIPPATTRAGY
jgi:succinyl-diaminopimelate desuccinylase